MTFFSLPHNTLCNAHVVIESHHDCRSTHRERESLTTVSLTGTNTPSLTHSHTPSLPPLIAHTHIPTYHCTGHHTHQITTTRTQILSLTRDPRLHLQKEAELMDDIFEGVSKETRQPLESLLRKVTSDIPPRHSLAMPSMHIVIYLDIYICICVHAYVSIYMCDVCICTYA